MSPGLALPIETIEAVIKFLDPRDDYRTIVSCSLLCRTFLPVCRTLLWRDLVIAKGNDSRVSVEVARLLEILKRSPEVRLYVRSVNFGFGPGRYSVEYVVEFCALFPALRSLTLRTLHEGALSNILTLIDSIPTLKELHLHDIYMGGESADPIHPDVFIDAYPTLNQITKLASLNATARSQNQPLLRVFSISKCYDIESTWLRKTIATLEGSRHASSLRSFGIEAATLTHRRNYLDLDTLPRVPSFAPHLTHIGFTLNQFVGIHHCIDIASSRTYVRRFCSDLRKCGALRSLRLHFDCTFAYSMHAYFQRLGRFAFARPVPPVLHEEPRYLLDRLAGVLSTPGSPPCPDLEHLSFVFFSPIDWLSGCGAAFARLAQACLDVDDAGPELGVRRRYPRFARLEIRFMISRIIQPDQFVALEEARVQFVQDKEKMMMPMLAPFEQEGIAVDVVLE
ncbi:hypothetical protein C8Q70DRAFT_249350 [Cubamyces menziesii]|uniref:F-box domain-containing protein n=1 Tax=Trametes cubensis TaxID=1111947 RepID=A0AAD7TFR2_9APHY|nr:hypothetical protein C8Q70DRAFT_249350 [Cubamyces menziesii]KAJ8454075.1 hypothetical protein ONZ51_g13238 [Trametes cubensis]